MTRHMLLITTVIAVCYTPCGFRNQQMFSLWLLLSINEQMLRYVLITLYASSKLIRIKLRLHQATSTKLLPVCCTSVAGYKGIRVAEIQATCCRQQATCCPGVNAA